MKEVSYRFIIVIMIIYLAIFSQFATGSGQDNAIKLPALQSYNIEVNIKLIKVRVTDRKGNNIDDLAKSDFVIIDNGKSQTITEFEVHRITAPTQEANSNTRKSVTLGISSSPLMGRKIFLVFDFAFSTPSGVARAQEAALNFIDTSILPEDEVGLISYSAFNQGIKIHEFLSIEHDKVRKAVRGLGLEKSNGRAEDLEEKYRRERRSGGLADASEGGIPGQAMIFNPPEATLDDLKMHAGRFAKLFTNLALAFRYIPGQKYFILLSGGVPGSAVYGDMAGINTGNIFTLLKKGDHRVRNAFEDMNKELSNSNIVVYALNSDPATAANELATGAYTLKNMASATGGRYFGDIDNYKDHFESIKKLTGAYYILGYYIKEKRDGKFHKIKVKTIRPGLDVHTQSGYYSPRPFSEYTDFEKDLQLVDLALNKNPLYQTPIRFSMLSIASSTSPEGNLCLIAKIPVSRIRNIADSKVEIIAIVFNALDDIVELRRTEEDLSGISEENAYYYAFLSAPAGIYQCRIVVRNLLTGAGSVGASSAIIPKRKERGIQLFLPVLLHPNRGARYLKGYVPKNITSSLISAASSAPFSNLFGFDPMLYAPYVEGMLSADSELWAAIRCAPINIAIPEILLSAMVTRVGGREETPVQVSVIDRIRRLDAETLFLAIKLPRIAPGNYMLNFVAEEKVGNSRSNVGREFTIK